MAPISPKEPYTRRLRVFRARPSQTCPPLDLTARASAQSSMMQPRIAARPPARSSDVGRISMQPPAAPATEDRDEAVHAGGYSLRKKKTKAGMRQRSAKVAVESRTIS